MTTLAKFRSLLRDRLAEISEEFWAEKNIRYYINSAQTFIATLTRGVRQVFFLYTSDKIITSKLNINI